MRRLATLAVVAALMSPTVAAGQDYSFGDWARGQGYSPGDVMPASVRARYTSIDSLDGIGEFDWMTTPTTELDLYGSWISSIEAGAFSGLPNLTTLLLSDNSLSSIEAGTLNGLTKLRELPLHSNQLSSIKAGTFNGLINLTELSLNDNQLSSIEAGAFSGLPNLEYLRLGGNQLSSIDSGTFSGLANLTGLHLERNIALTELNLSEADFSSLRWFDLGGNVNISSISLRNTVVNQMPLATLLDGGNCIRGCGGIGDINGTIVQMDLSGIDFADITDLSPLYVMDDLTDLWLVDTANLDAFDLDVLLDNLATIEGADTEGVLHMTLLNFIDFVVAGDGLLAAWDAEPGHHVEYLLIGDVNHDTEVNGLDVDPFVDVLLASRFDVAADMNGDGVVNGLDVDPFVAAVVGSGTQPVPEPSTLLLCIVIASVISAWTDWRRILGLHWFWCRSSPCPDGIASTLRCCDNRARQHVI
jgi:hypothetical protein